MERSGVVDPPSLKNTPRRAPRRTQFESPPSCCRRRQVLVHLKPASGSHKGFRAPHEPKRSTPPFAAPDAEGGRGSSEISSQVTTRSCGGTAAARQFKRITCPLWHRCQEASRLCDDLAPMLTRERPIAHFLQTRRVTTDRSYCGAGSRSRWLPVRVCADIPAIRGTRGPLDVPQRIRVDAHTVGRETERTL